MKKLQIACLAMVIASGMAFAGVDDLWWFPGVKNGQVTFPWVFDCKNGPGSTFNEANSNDPCFKTLGGWWFGVVYGPSVEMNDDTYHCGNAQTRRSGVNQVWLKNYEGGKTNFVGADNSSCEGPDVADRETGDPKFEGDHLHFELTIGPGDFNNYDPDGAAIGVAFSTPADRNNPVLEKRNMAEYSNGLCIKYTSDHEAGSTANGSAGHDVALELDWAANGAPPHGSDEYDTWVYYFQPTDEPKVVNLNWTGTYESAPCYTPNRQGDFQQDNWAGCNVADEEKPTTNPVGDLNKATREMTQINIRLKGYEAKTVNFKIYQFGALGDCSGEVLPLIPKKTPNNVNFALNGKVLSANISKPAMVQIYNLQGAIVKSQTLSPKQTMNLSNLPTGIYMVRAPSLGYTSRIVVK